MKLKVFTAIVTCLLVATSTTVSSRTKTRLTVAKAPTKTLVERLGYPCGYKTTDRPCRRSGDGPLQLTWLRSKDWRPAWLVQPVS